VKSITNKTRSPLKVPLPGGKFLHLGPNKTGQIAEHAAEAPAIQRLVKKGTIEILAEGAQPVGAGQGKAASGHEATHGHVQNTMMRPKGDR